MLATPLNAQALAPTRVRLPKASSSRKKVNWTKEEDERLLGILTKTVGKPNWSQIATEFPNKTTQQVTERWDKVINPDLIKGSWTRQEDETIINFVKEHGCKNWTKLSNLLPGRIGKQCRERWRNHLDPTINHSNWTTEEDLLLLKLHEQYGNQWVKISKALPGRSENSIKNRWNSTLKKVTPTNISPAPSPTTVNPVNFERMSPIFSPVISMVGFWSTKKSRHLQDAPSSPGFSSVESNRQLLQSLLLPTADDTV